ncbi:hypothetical protein QJS04_geneDACA014038 [Acorus gramineus]|uniref:Uncharacterized protein n=1 Tax=Acorus gramineus TaxID=55184 RepID=A0AAV9AUQ6_ACOGR|nr:hypothetical protein QJS04_geneDACA014038 [Acorus gramineus]
MCNSRKAITSPPHLHHHIRRTHCDGRPRAMLFCCCYNPASTLAVVVVTAALLASSTDTLSNVPQTLSAGDDPGGPTRIQHPKSRRAESCTVKCVTTCIRGGAGSPGEGPLNARRPLVVFKQGFRSRQYCLVECSDICNLIRDGDDGP